MAKEMHKVVGVIPKKEMIQILEGLKEKNRKHYQAIYFLVATGFRTIELIHLKFKDIDLKKNLIAIKNTKCKRIDYFPIYPPLKEFIINEFPVRKGKVFDFKNYHSLKFFERFLKNEGYNHYTLRALRKTFISRVVNLELSIIDIMVMAKLHQPNILNKLYLRKRI